MDYLHSTNMRDVFKKVYVNNDRGYVLRSELTGQELILDDDRAYNAYKLEEIAEEDVPMYVLNYVGESDTRASYTENAMRTIGESLDSDDFPTAVYWAKQTHTFDSEVYRACRSMYLTKDRLKKIMTHCNKKLEEERKIR